ncbi:MAG: hypothetical protein F9K44_06435 [Hyphomicrobiaceae bacterium]|nr:MAG: hypothetical protein F9K44_06435 [Hyphomicrobiaceae bacterium]
MSLSMSLEDRQDDLPRTLRRKSLRTEEDAALESPPLRSNGGSVVTGFDIPFTRLVAFCFKLAFAAIPALVFLGAALYVIGTAVGVLFPSLKVVFIGYHFR